MDLKSYHDRHGDLVSAERASIEGGGIWAGRMSVEPLPDDVIEGMPADWLERQLGEETARKASFLSPYPFLFARCTCLTGISAAYGEETEPQASFLSPYLFYLLVVHTLFGLL